MLKVSAKMGIPAVVGALGFACGPPHSVNLASVPNPERTLQAIDGRIVDLDFVTTREDIVNSGIMKLVTAEGDTFLLLTPADVRCKPGSHGHFAGFRGGMAIRVYLKPEDVNLARKQHVVGEWAEVECTNNRP